MSRPRLLDLFCGAGGASMGYSRAGFDVVGVDLHPQPNYPFAFFQDDALDVLRVLAGGACYTLNDVNPILRDVSVVHASPPCQGYTTMNNRHGSSSPLLIEQTRARLQAAGVPWVIENVEGARSALVNPIRLTGAMFGLGVHRPRLFESNVLLLAPTAPPRQTDVAAVYGKNDGRRVWTRTDGTELRVATLERGSEAMGISWMDWDELREAIPPAYCEYIGRQLLAAVVSCSVKAET